MRSEAGTGGEANSVKQNLRSTSKTDQLSRYRIRRYQTPILRERMKLRLNFHYQQVGVKRSQMGILVEPEAKGERLALRETNLSK